MAQMSPIETDNLAIAELGNIVPNDLLLAEGGPAVAPTLGHELIDRAAHRRDKQRLASHTVIVSQLTGRLDFRLEGASSTERVARVLSPVAIEAADAISGAKIGPIEQIRLSGRDASAVLPLPHDAFRVWPIATKLEGNDTTDDDKSCRDADEYVLVL